MKTALNLKVFIFLSIIAGFFFPELALAQLDVPDSIEGDDALAVGKNSAKQGILFLQVIVWGSALFFGWGALKKSWDKYQNDREDYGVMQFLGNAAIIIIMVIFGIVISLQFDFIAAKLA